MRSTLRSLACALSVGFLLAFVASAGICCLNPQPEPPTESAAVADPGDRGNDGAVGGGDSPGGQGSSGAGGMLGGEAGGGSETPTDPNDGVGGNGDFGNGSGGTTGASAGGNANGGAGGSAAPPDVPGGSGGREAEDEDEDPTCNTCGQVLLLGGNPCPSALPKLEALVSCCHAACGACKERIVRGDHVGSACTECLAEACPAAFEACKAD